MLLLYAQALEEKKYLFNSEYFENSREIILAILPYYDHATKHVLELIGKVNWPVTVEVKFHPTMNWKNYESMIPENVSVTSDPVSELFKKTQIAFEQFEEVNKKKLEKFVIAGGVAANKKIRKMLINLCKEKNVLPIFPPRELCGDNAAMIAMVGLEKFKLNQFNDLDHQAIPRWQLDDKANYMKGAGVKL